MDLCMSYLYEASQLANDYKEVDLYHEIFEGSAMDAINAQNEQIVGKSESLLTKAANMIKAIIRKAQEIISNVMSWFKADDSEKDQFRKFREECKNNPEFANKKITLTNWREIDAKYSTAIKKAEAEYKTCKDEENAAKPKILSSLTKYLGNITKAGVLSVTVEGALKMAEESQTAAFAIKGALDKDLGVIDQLEQSIGKKETKKFKRKINGLNSKFAIRRWIAGAREKQAEGQQGKIREIFSKVRTAYLDSKPSRAARILKRARGNEDFKSASNAIVGTAYDAAKQNKGLLKLTLKNTIRGAKAGRDGSFNIKIDGLINQFSSNKFSNENLKKYSARELNHLLDEAKVIQSDLERIIKTNKKGSKKFDVNGQKEWSKTIGAKGAIDRLVDNIEDIIDNK